MIVADCIFQRSLVRHMDIAQLLAYLSRMSHRCFHRSFEYLAQPHLRSSSVGRLASGGCRLERALICRAGILSTPHKRKYTVKSTLYGRVRYPLCGGCRCRPKRQMGSRQLAPKGMRRIRSEGLYGGLVGILYGPGITGGSFPFLYRKSAGLATPNGPRLRTCV